MDDHLIKSPKRITTKYVFKSKIEKVWDLLMDYEFLFKILFGDLVISYEFIKENQLDKLGAEFKVICKSYSLLFQCTYLLNNHHYKKINYKVCSIAKELEGMNHDFTYTLISNTVEGSTIFVWDFEFENPEILPMTTDALEEYKTSRFICIKRWSDHLNKNINDMIQYESIMIDSSRKEIWDVITNWCVLKTVSPIIADEIQSHGDQLQVGSELKLIFYNKKNVQCHLKVLKVNCDLHSQDWEYCLECNCSKPNVPFQEIKFSIVFLKPNKSFLIFQHFFKEQLELKFINSISNEKKKILSDIKNYLEK
jgi:hypothetical protein